MAGRMEISPASVAHIAAKVRQSKEAFQEAEWSLPNYAVADTGDAALDEAIAVMLGDWRAALIDMTALLDHIADATAAAASSYSTCERANVSRLRSHS